MGSLSNDPIASPPLGVHVSTTDGAVVVRLMGELDLGGVQRVEQALLSAEAQAPELLLIDLSSLEFIDSSGLRVLLRAQERSLDQGRRLQLRRGSEAVQRIFTVTCLDRRMEFVD
jgi:anti-sigma B factor antagonist